MAGGKGSFYIARCLANNGHRVFILVINRNQINGPKAGSLLKRVFMIPKIV